MFTIIVYERMEEISMIEIRFHGRGGQGAVTAAEILAKAAFRYQVYNPDHVIVLDDGLLSVVDVYSGLKEDGEVIINTHEKVESASHKVFDVDATGIALEILGVNIVNTIILGYFAKKTGEVSIESLIEVIKETFPGPIGEKNAVAAQKAYDMA